MRFEESLIGAILLQPSILAELDISFEDFSIDAHAKIFQAIKDLEGTAIDLLTVSEKLKEKNELEAVGGELYLAKLTNCIPTALNFKEYEKSILEVSRRNQIKKLCNKIRSSCEQEIIDEDAVSELNKIFVKHESEKPEIYDIIDDLVVELGEGKKRGLPTGIKPLDSLTVGLREGHFWIIGATRKTGKTNFVLKIVRNLAVNHLVYFYSLEMPKVDLAARIYWEIRNEGKNRDEAIDIIGKMKLKIFESKRSISKIESHLLSGEKPRVIIIDYIQLLRGDKKTIYENMSDIALRLQALPKNRGLTIIALSQLPNEDMNTKSRQKKFKGAGEIADACDVGIFLSRDIDSEEGIERPRIVCDILYNRHGEGGIFEGEFDKKRNFLIF